VMCREVQTSLRWLINDKGRKTEIIKFVRSYRPSVHRSGTWGNLRNMVRGDL